MGLEGVGLNSMGASGGIQEDDEVEKVGAWGGTLQGTGELRRAWGGKSTTCWVCRDQMEGEVRGIGEERNCAQAREGIQLGFEGGGSCEATDSAMLARAMERASAGHRDSAGDMWDSAGVAD